MKQVPLALRKLIQRKKDSNILNVEQDLKLEPKIVIEKESNIEEKNEINVKIVLESKSITSNILNENVVTKIIEE